MDQALESKKFISKLLFELSFSNIFTKVLFNAIGYRRQKLL